MVKYKESESESEGAEHAAERFRVRVCMQRFYGAGDVRARAYVCVAPRRRVRWLQRRLRRLFALPPVRLLSRGHLLPPQEPLALLQPDDPVEVVPEDAEPEDTTAARNVVDSADEAQVAPVSELERSSRPVSPDDLTETKRQALSMLEQYCVEPAANGAAECATEAPRARRRRVRRRPRRRAPGRSQSGAGSDADASGFAAAALCDELQPGAAALCDELQPGAAALCDELQPGAAALCDELQPGAAALCDELQPGAAALCDELQPGAAALCDELQPSAAPAFVLRDELKPRAPRVVRPLADRVSVSPLGTPPAEIVTG